MAQPGLPPNPPKRSIRSLNAPALWGLSILVGIVSGLGAVLFRALIGFLHNLLFLGNLSAAYDANIHTPSSPWGPWIILVPAAGALGVAFLVKNFAPEAKGHGVPEVMDAVYHRRGIIRPVVSLVKALASALSIGSGASIGREGPIIQIGSSFGSTVGQLLGLPAWQRITLIAAGAGGGIGATFNTPVGGVLFAVEIILHEVSARTLVPVVTATATATYIGQLFFGPHPSFSIPALETPFFVVAKPIVLAAYASLGAIAGLVSAIFIRSIYGCEELFEKYVKGGYYVQHAMGMLAVGSLMYALMRRFGHYYVQGVGYATIQDLLGDVRYSLLLLVLLFAAKLLATSLTLGSGASGGVFSPALFLGATSGAAWGVSLNHFFPSLHVSPAAFAVVGMGGVVGGSTGAAMAAIVMIFEMTLDYTVVVPLTLTVAISYGVRRGLIKDSIYTRKLRLRGDPVPESMRADVQLSRLAADMMGPPSPELLVPFVTTGNGARSDYVTVPVDDSLWDVIAKMRACNASVALVTSKDGQFTPADVQGVITARTSWILWPMIWKCSEGESLPSAEPTRDLVRIPRLCARASRSIAQLRSGVLSLPNSIVRVVPNEALFRPPSRCVNA
jgi:CIC family chloride channel protein